MHRKMITRVSLIGLMAAASVFLWTTHNERTEAHCQVPCGIYDDAARITRLREDAKTIAKATDQILELAGSHEAQAFNQAARWVATKEQHATHIIDVVSAYFLTQKVKPVKSTAPGYDAYLKKLADHHAVMVAAMKAKQNANLAFVHALDHAIDALAAHYK